ncbi:MAG TPA: translocation/assembly module TamB domain-containing protein, partial [Gemmatimonadaceae bacterium]|nr:translocation/assembly module TamB domain-containing protein [Gemmatimonadaceae bacterium]
DSASRTVLRALALAVDRPDVAVVAGRGTFRWWRDSLRIDVPTLRLPGSVASARGAVAWGGRGPARIAVDVRADTVDLADVHRLAPLAPPEGTARAVVAIRSGAGGAIGYDVREFDVRAGDSHVAGALRVTPGRRTEVRDVAITLAPLDLALVRRTLGDTVLPPAWRGALTGEIAARGGPLDSLVIDSLALTYADARIGGARSRVVVSGAVDAAAAPARLLGVHVTIDPLVVRTLGAAARAADSVAGIVRGDVTLGGTPRDLEFTGLLLAHVDDGAVSVALSGAGRVSPGRQGHWLDAALTLDTIAIATLARGRTTAPLRGSPHGTLELHATHDTLRVETSLAEGAATLHVAGTTLLDSARTVVALAGTVHQLDPRAFVARPDVPAALLSGRATIAVDDAPGAADRHVELFLDSTSTVGESRLRMADVRFGVDAGGFHVDTAEVHADTWHLSARGKLARDSTRSDTLSFDGAVDSLAALRSILLDSTGAPRLADLTGRVRVDSGRIAGSFADAHLVAGVTATDLRVGGDTIASAAGTLDLARLPDHASGTLAGVVAGFRAGPVVVDSAVVSAQVADGERARFAVRGLGRNATRVTATGDLTWPASGYEGRVDSLVAAIGEHRWQLAAPASFAVRPGGVTVDSAVLRSDHGATVAASAALPDRGPVTAHVRVSQLGFEELAFVGVFPEDMTGLISAAADVSGTRDAPIIAATATLDSIRSDDRERPSLRVGLDYAGHMAKMRASVTVGDRTSLDAHGDVPLDLTLRAVADRLPDAPIALQLAADSLGLAAFDGLAPRLRELSGSLNGRVQVAGTLRHPRGTGTLTLRDAAFDLPRFGFSARHGAADLQLADDSVIVRQFRLADADSPRDTAAITGVVHFAGREWTAWVADLHSVASNFRVIDDPRLASTKANWDLAVTGALREPHVTGDVLLPYGVFTIGPQRRAHAVIPDSATAPLGTPNADGVVVTLGSDVRLKSKEANVQLAGGVELFGALNRPWISGSVQATRGTYRVDLGPLSRTFRVDSGVVILEGTSDVPPALDIHTSYIVKQPNSTDDVKIGAHLYGTTDRPRLDLSSDLGSAASQSEIISYLVFGKPSFAVPEGTGAAAQTAYDAVVPSILGGYLESLLSTVLPFFNTLQVTAVGRDDPRFSISNPIENLLNSFAVTGGRQIGTDTFLTLTTGVCTGSSVSTTNASPIWFGTSAEYRPKRSIGAAISIDPGPAPCSRVVAAGDAYQLGFDLLYDWRFGRRK